MQNLPAFQPTLFSAAPSDLLRHALVCRVRFLILIAQGRLELRHHGRTLEGRSPGKERSFSNPRMITLLWQMSPTLTRVYGEVHKYRYCVTYMYEIAIAGELIARVPPRSDLQRNM